MKELGRQLHAFAYALSRSHYSHYSHYSHKYTRCTPLHAHAHGFAVATPITTPSPCDGLPVPVPATPFLMSFIVM